MAKGRVFKGTRALFLLMGHIIPYLTTPVKMPPTSVFPLKTLPPIRRKSIASCRCPIPLYPPLKGRPLSLHDSRPHSH